VTRKKKKFGKGNMVENSSCTVMMGDGAVSLKNQRSSGLPEEPRRTEETEEKEGKNAELCWL